MKTISFSSFLRLILYFCQSVNKYLGCQPTFIFLFLVAVITEQRVRIRFYPKIVSETIDMLKESYWYDAFGCAIVFDWQRNVRWNWQAFREISLARNREENEEVCAWFVELGNNIESDQRSAVFWVKLGSLHCIQC